jgi:hypothetical protein
MPKTYDDAIAAHNRAAAVFRAAQTAYRTRQIGDAEFLAARAAYDESTKIFDAAFTAEQVRVENERACGSRREE